MGKQRLFDGRNASDKSKTSLIRTPWLREHEPSLPPDMQGSTIVQLRSLASRSNSLRDFLHPPIPSANDSTLIHTGLFSLMTPSSVLLRDLRMGQASSMGAGMWYDKCKWSSVIYEYDNTTAMNKQRRPKLSEPWSMRMCQHKNLDPEGKQGPFGAVEVAKY